MGADLRLKQEQVIMRKCRLILAVFLALHCINAVFGQSIRINQNEAPQDDEDDEKALERQLCSDKEAGLWFRLETGKNKCRDVILRTVSGLQAIRCPAGLAFDIEKQTCDWKASVKNCDAKTKE